MNKIKLVLPEKATRYMEAAAERYWADRRFSWFSDDPRTWAGVYDAMTRAAVVHGEAEVIFPAVAATPAAAPAVQGEPDVEYGPTPGCKQCEEAMSINLDSCPECDAEFCAPQPVIMPPPPAVQGEPVAWLKRCGDKIYLSNDSRYGELWPEQWEPLYTAPQPVEQQYTPHPDEDYTPEERGCPELEPVPDEQEPFNREDRYIVIKRSDLDKVAREDVKEQFLTALDRLNAHDVRIPQRQYVVVESDWPEFEPVWSMIQARMTGQPAPDSEALRRKCDNAQLALKYQTENVADLVELLSKARSAVSTLADSRRNNAYVVACAEHAAELDELSRRIAAAIRVHRKGGEV